VGCSVRIRSRSSPIIIGGIIYIFIGNNSSNFVINTLLPFWASRFYNCHCSTRFKCTFLTSYADYSTSCRNTWYKTILIYFSYSCITWSDSILSVTSIWWREGYLKLIGFSYLNIWNTGCQWNSFNRNNFNSDSTNSFKLSFNSCYRNCGSSYRLTSYNTIYIDGCNLNISRSPLNLLIACIIWRNCCSQLKIFIHCHISS
jgi:hypothetical protein